MSLFLEWGRPKKFFSPTHTAFSFNFPYLGLFLETRIWGAQRKFLWPKFRQNRSSIETNRLTVVIGRFTQGALSRPYGPSGLFPLDNPLRHDGGRKMSPSTMAQPQAKSMNLVLDRSEGPVVQPLFDPGYRGTFCDHPLNQLVLFCGPWFAPGHGDCL